MVPVRNDPDAVPACHERVDIHPVELIKMMFLIHKVFGHVPVM